MLVLRPPILTSSLLLARLRDWNLLLSVAEPLISLEIPVWSFSQISLQLPKVPLVHTKIGIIWSFTQNYHQLPEIPLVQPKIDIIWSISQKYYQLPEVLLVQPKIDIIFSFSQNYHHLPKTPMV